VIILYFSNLACLARCFILTSLTLVYKWIVALGYYVWRSRFFFTEVVCSILFVCTIREIFIHSFIHSFRNKAWCSLIKYGEVFSFRQRPNKCCFCQQANWGRKLLTYKTKFLHVRTLSVIVIVNVNVNVNVNTLPHCRAASSGYKYPRNPGTVINKCSTVQYPPLVECVCAWNV
jgi:hypothetical protein